MIKNLIIIIALLLPVSAFSQDYLELVSSNAREEHPGIPQSPVVYTVVHNFIAQEDGIKIEAVRNDGTSDNVIDSRVMYKGDRLSLKYITYSYYHSDPPPDENFSEDPYFADIIKDIITLVFPGYDTDKVKTTTSFPVFYVNDVKYEFNLPIIKDVDIERIYYP
jgi:hypothetical protein